MKLTELLPAFFDREVAISSRVLARVPEGRPDWKPHAKSMPLGYLGTLVATMPRWVAMAILQDELDLAPKDGQKYDPGSWTTNAELLALHDQSIAAGREALRGTSDAHLATKWRLLVAGNVVQESPRHEVVTDTLTHLAHHRGQLSVYLRLLDAQVPSIYGPSADEPKFG
jgi:uncharacterized damage-inducible protein DinB